MNGHYIIYIPPGRYTYPLLDLGKFSKIYLLAIIPVPLILTPPDHYTPSGLNTPSRLKYPLDTLPMSIFLIKRQLRKLFMVSNFTQKCVKLFKNELNYSKYVNLLTMSNLLSFLSLQCTYKHYTKVLFIKVRAI